MQCAPKKAALGHGINMRVRVLIVELALLVCSLVIFALSFFYPGRARDAACTTRPQPEEAAIALFPRGGTGVSMAASGDPLLVSHLLERAHAARNLLLPLKTHKYVPQLARMTLRATAEKAMWLARMARAEDSARLCDNLQRAVADLNVPTSDKQYLPLQWRRQFLACLDAVVSAVLKTPLTLREVLDAERNERELARAAEAEFVASFERFSVAVPKKLQDALSGTNHVRSGHSLLVPKEAAEFVRDAASGTGFQVRPVEGLRLLSEQGAKLENGSVGLFLTVRQRDGAADCGFSP